MDRDSRNVVWMMGVAVAGMGWGLVRNLAYYPVPPSLLQEGIGYLLVIGGLTAIGVAAYFALTDHGE